MATFSSNITVTGTTTTSSLVVSNTTSMYGNLNMNLCNITNLGTDGFSLNVGQFALSFSVTPSATVVSGGYTYYICTASCTITPNYAVSNVAYFMVAGGGGGGFNFGGGGGAGGLRTNDSTLSGTILSSQYDGSGYLSLASGGSYSICLLYTSPSPRDS